MVLCAVWATCPSESAVVQALANMDGCRLDEERLTELCMLPSAGTEAIHVTKTFFSPCQFMCRLYKMTSGAAVFGLRRPVELHHFLQVR